MLKYKPGDKVFYTHNQQEHVIDKGFIAPEDETNYYFLVDWLGPVPEHRLKPIGKYSNIKQKLKI